MKWLHKLFPVGHVLIVLLFTGSALALIVLAALQLWQGVQFFGDAAFGQLLNAVLESIAVLTVALAALELAQTILEEEVMRDAHMSAPTRVRRFLSRFMIVLVVALSIETLVLVFRVSHDSPELLPSVAMVGFAAAALLIGWGVFVRLNRAAEELEPEGMRAAKREDRKVDKSNNGGSER